MSQAVTDVDKWSDGPDLAAQQRSLGPWRWRWTSICLKNCGPFLRPPQSAFFEVRKGRRRTTSCMSRFDALTDSMTTGNLALHPSYLKLPHFNAFQRLIPVQNDVKMSVFFFIYAVPVYPYGVCPLVKPSSPTLPPSVNPTGIFNRTSEANFNLRFFGFRRRVSEGWWGEFPLDSHSSDLIRKVRRFFVALLLSPHPSSNFIAHWGRKEERQADRGGGGN